MKRPAPFTYSVTEPVALRTKSINVLISNSMRLGDGHGHLGRHLAGVVVSRHVR